MKRVFLIGYMGSGKTTIGKLVAEKLGYGFVDMDAHIEEKYFNTISNIFAELGEEQFRLMEQRCLHEVSDFEDVIISTGGGAPCFFDNMEYMKSQGLTIYLKLTAAELAERLEASQANKRPLIAGRSGEELKKIIADGLAKRETFYSQAAYALSGGVDETVNEICTLISRQ